MQYECQNIYDLIIYHLEHYSQINLQSHFQVKFKIRQSKLYSFILNIHVVSLQEPTEKH